MPNFISIDASQLETFGAQIGAAGDIIRDVSHRMTDNIARDTVVFAQHQPAPPRGIKQPFKTDKQRRFFFSALRRGEIVVPYRRTGTLYINWRFRSLPGGDVFTAEVYNDTPYREVVQGPKNKQSKFHAPRWNSQEKIEDAMEKAGRVRLKEAENELEQLFLRRLGR